MTKTDSVISELTFSTSDMPALPVARGLRVVIQGVRGAFHEIATRHFFGADVEIVPALSFPELFSKVADPASADAAVLAIENNIAGSILGNYKLLNDSHLRIIGEVSIPIQQNLLCLPGVSLDDLQEVHSHPMALAQCGAFFKAYPHIRLVESEDTAESAARIAKQGLRHVGAIASTLAAELYDLEILAPGIEDNPNNYTRFLAVEPIKRPVLPAETQNTDVLVKCAISFATPHTSGALSKALSLLAAYGANLTKIQSVPIAGRMWEYQFFVDFTHHRRDEVPAILELLATHVMDLKVFGVYAADAP
jgi:prephenate dehydratase